MLQFNLADPLAECRGVATVVMFVSQFGIILVSIVVGGLRSSKR
jgi:hypothetical protein